MLEQDSTISAPRPMPAAQPTHLFSNILLPLFLDNRHCIRFKHSHSLALPLRLSRLSHRSAASTPWAVTIAVVIVPITSISVIVTRVAP